MNEHQLSKRLTEVASLVPVGCRLADIGSDHSYLPAHLLIQGKVCTAIAGEVNEGPLLSAQNLVEKLGLGSVMYVRKGNGLEVIEEGEVDVISIAGMGGALICQILNEGLEKLTRTQRLILQPNVASHLVRQWLIHHNWELKYESMIEEDNKFYEVLMAEPGNPELPYDGLNTRERERAILMGPYLLQDKTPAFIRKWKAEIDKRNKIISSLHHSTGEGKEEKLYHVSEEISLMEEGIKE
jgi:tRNA (adenine22-N1)-methyltransferase